MKPIVNILLAEDNPVNQEVGRAMLESFGCRVDVASNGAEVLDRLANGKYDIIFMDCEMPVMDGFQATRRIREAERGGGSKVPVIALTAHIMDDDRKRCTDAGMDDYLGKPFRLRELSDMLDRWTEPEVSPVVQAEAVEKEAPRSGAEQECLDRSSLENIRSLQGVDGAKMLATVIRIYLSDTPALLGKLHQALADGDAGMLARVAHALKSCSSNLGAFALAQACKRLEDCARGNPVEGGEALLAEIREQYRMVRDALERELVRTHEG